MIPKTRAEWAVLCKLFGRIRVATPYEREIMLDQIEVIPARPAYRFRRYRFLLDAWQTWWQTRGRQHYTGEIGPPFLETAEVLRCDNCAGLATISGGHCVLCGREVEERP